MASHDLQLGICSDVTPGEIPHLLLHDYVPSNDSSTGDFVMSMAISTQFRPHISFSQLDVS